MDYAVELGWVREGGRFECTVHKRCSDFGCEAVRRKARRLDCFLLARLQPGVRGVQAGACGPAMAVSCARCWVGLKLK